jgi:hypothetical protein
LRRGNGHPAVHVESEWRGGEGATGLHRDIERVFSWGRRIFFFCIISDVSEGCRERFVDTNKKQITEPVKKLQDESNNIN